MKTVVLIGDSIRMGYQGVVARELKGVARVWGPEENGETSRNVLSHLEEWVIARSPDVVHLNCGLHDVRKEFGSDEARVPLRDYEANLRKMFQRLARQTGTSTLWALTTPVNEKRHHANKPFDRFEADVDAYNKTARQVAGEFRIPVNDLFSVVTAAGRDRLLSEDGVHFSEEGYEALGKAVAGFIMAHIRR